MLITFEEAAALLRQGQIAAIPTETVYGLAADARCGQAVAQIYAAKGRPAFNPLIAHVADGAQAQEFTLWNKHAHVLAQAFWDRGLPLTMVLPLRPHGDESSESSPSLARPQDAIRISSLVTAGLDTVAVRCPGHAIALELIRACGFPLAAPSANRSNHISPTEAQAVLDSLGMHIPVLDGGRCGVGLESTIVDLTAELPVVLRPGAVTAEDIAVAAGVPVSYLKEYTAIKAPGMQKRHYAPKRPLRLNALGVAGIHEALLGFGPTATEATLNLSVTGNLAEAAANLFHMLREVDRAPYKAIAVMPIPETGIGIAINDRLRRAASLG